MKRVLRSGRFVVTTDTCFDRVVDACSSVEREGQDGTWITPDMKEAYQRLYRNGHAHSVEVWLQHNLVGGLYGVHVSDVFCGESMFSLVSDASKTALIWLCQTGLFKLIDCQVHTGHLASMGARLISREEYMTFLGE